MAASTYGDPAAAIGQASAMIENTNSAVWLPGPARPQFGHPRGLRAWTQSDTFCRFSGVRSCVISALLPRRKLHSSAALTTPNVRAVPRYSDTGSAGRKKTFRTVAVRSFSKRTRHPSIVFASVTMPRAPSGTPQSGSPSFLESCTLSPTLNLEEVISGWSVTNRNPSTVPAAYKSRPGAGLPRPRIDGESAKWI